MRTGRQLSAITAHTHVSRVEVSLVGCFCNTFIRISQVPLIYLSLTAHSVERVIVRAETDRSARTRGHFKLKY